MQIHPHCVVGEKKNRMKIFSQILKQHAHVASFKSNLMPVSTKQKTEIHSYQYSEYKHTYKGWLIRRSCELKQIRKLYAACKDSNKVIEKDVASLKSYPYIHMEHPLL